MFAMTARYLPPPPPDVAPPPQWGNESVVRERLGDKVGDIAFARQMMIVPALSIPHYRETIERAAGPVAALVETLANTDPERLATFSRELDAIAADYFEDNWIKQEYLMTRATKI
jgi:hypothetical protein